VSSRFKIVVRFRARGVYLFSYRIFRAEFSLGNRYLKLGITYDRAILKKCRAITQCGCGRVISDCHIVLGLIVTFGDRLLSPPRQSPYKMRQSCDCHDCHTATIVGSTCNASTDYIGKLHTTWIIVTDCQFVTSLAGLSVIIGYYPTLWACFCVDCTRPETIDGRRATRRRIDFIGSHF
jgi:hypothetical protein